MNKKLTPVFNPYPFEIPGTNQIKIYVMKNFYKSVLMVIALSGSFFTNAQVLSLDSYSSANPVIYLDFDGHTISGSLWNVYGPFICNSSGLNETQITEIFNRISEDFRPFNINVTTNELKYYQAPAYQRMRLVITTSYEWYGTGAGGVAYMNSFSWSDDTPAFVFSSLLGFNIKNIAEAASHEVGHTLGLRHQSSYDANCAKISEYNWGVGTGEIGWAPIMGTGYGKNLTLWHNGPNSTGCNNLQSDLSIITNDKNGFGYRRDDNSDVYTTATTANFNSSHQFKINGVVEKTDDKDFFKFIIPDFVRFRLNALPYNVGTGNSGSDLDLQVELFDRSYNSLGLYNPGTLLSSVVDTFLNSGTYYLKVGNTGNIYAPQYASLGSYSLQGSYNEASSIIVRHFELKGQLEKDIHILNWMIEADETVTKQDIEVSSDGRNFNELNQPGNMIRSYSYKPTDGIPLRYRVHVTFNNNKEYYSNVITLRQGTVLKPQLIGNTISGNYISVNSPATYNYHVMDMSGKILNKGIVSKGFSSIETSNTSSGIYLIRFANGFEQWTEKFIKN